MYEWVGWGRGFEVSWLNIKQLVYKTIMPPINTSKSQIGLKYRIADEQKVCVLFISIIHKV